MLSLSLIGHSKKIMSIHPSIDAFEALTNILTVVRRPLEIAMGHPNCLVTYV